MLMKDKAIEKIRSYEGSVNNARIDAEYASLKNDIIDNFSLIRVITSMFSGRTEA